MADRLDLLDRLKAAGFDYHYADTAIEPHVITHAASGHKWTRTKFPTGLMENLIENGWPQTPAKEE